MNHMWHVTCHMSHATCDMSHFACHRSHVTYLMSQVSCLMSHVSCLMSYVSCLMSHVSCLMSHVSCRMSHVTCHMSHGSCHVSHITYYMMSPSMIQYNGWGRETQKTTRINQLSPGWSHDITHDTLDDMTLVKWLESGDTQTYSNKSEVTNSEILALKQVLLKQTWLEVDKIQDPAGY